MIKATNFFYKMNTRSLTIGDCLNNYHSVCLFICLIVDIYVNTLRRNTKIKLKQRVECEGL